MAMEITNNYSTYENIYATQKQQTEKKQAASGKEISETVDAQKNSKVGNDKTKSTADYAKKLEKLVPSVEFRVGNACVSAQSGKLLTVNPKLLEKMQNDPQKAKDMQDMIKGVESMSKLAASIAKATGWTIVYQHSYIDENGKYHCRMQTRNDGMLKLSDKLREERKKNSEKLLERSKEKAADKEEDKTSDKAEQLLLDKAENSEDGIIYLNDEDMKTIMDSIKENAEQTTDKDTMTVGANLDLQV